MSLGDAIFIIYSCVALGAALVVIAWARSIR